MGVSDATAAAGPGRRVVFAYGLVAAATQMLWLTYAAITTGAARRLELLLEVEAAAAVLAAGCAGSVALAFVGGIAGRAVVLAATGALLLPALPVIMTVAERLAGAAAGTAGTIVWMAGNLGGLVVALLVQSLVSHPTAAFLAMALTFLLATPLARRMVSLGGVADVAPEGVEAVETAAA